MQLKLNNKVIKAESIRDRHFTPLSADSHRSSGDTSDRNVSRKSSFGKLNCEINKAASKAVSVLEDII